MDGGERGIDPELVMDGGHAVVIPVGCGKGAAIPGELRECRLDQNSRSSAAQR